MLYLMLTILYNINILVTCHCMCNPTKGCTTSTFNHLTSQLLLEWHVPLAQVLPRSQLIFPSKTWFFGIYLILAAKITLK
jgi:hypothetical protein